MILFQLLCNHSRQLSSFIDDKMEGPCGRFRFQEIPKVKVGLVFLERKRPWPSCVNPDTGNQWSHDMKQSIGKIVESQEFPFEVFPFNELKVDDDPSVRLASCEFSSFPADCFKENLSYN